MEKFAYFHTQPFDNFVLVPKINRNGDIKGSYLMINYNAVTYGAYKITSDE